MLACGEQELASSHAVKRFFTKFSFVQVYLFRHLLQRLFIWRLKKTCPTVIELGLDSMVLDNDDALKRQGVQPTYKKVKGFHPLQMNWGRYMVDAVFRGGSKHSNHGKTAEKMLVHIVKKIRVYGDGQQERSFSYVDDIARGVVVGLKPVGFEIVNFGSDQSVKLTDAIALAEKLLGKKAKIQYLP